MRAYSLINRTQSMTGVMHIEDGCLHIKVTTPKGIEDLFSKELADWFSSKGFAVKSLYENMNMRMTSGQFSLSKMDNRQRWWNRFSEKVEIADKNKEKVLELLSKKNMTVAELSFILGLKYYNILGYIKYLKANNSIEAKGQRATKGKPTEWGLKK